MTQKLPFRRELKMQARRLMLHPLCMRATLLLVGAQMAFFGLRYLLDGTLSYSLVSLSGYGDTASGLYILDEGINLIFRMDLTGMVLAVALTYRQIRTFLIVNGVFFLLLAPLRVGAMEIYWSVLRGRTARVGQVFRWFLQSGRLVKAWLVEFLLQGVMRAVAFVASLPSFYLFYLFYTNTPDVASFTRTSQLLQMGATALAVLAALLAFWVHSLLLPVRYCLAAHPEYTVRETFRRGVQSAKGVRGAFFRFRLSYLLWFLVSQLTYGAMDLFVTPYSTLGGMCFLQAAARARQQERPDNQLPPQA